MQTVTPEELRKNENIVLYLKTSLASPPSKTKTEQTFRGIASMNINFKLSTTSTEKSRH